MARMATGILILVGLLLACTKAMEGRYPILGWGSAFLQAALVGALADWFAVVALFRHPMGIPFWHTAVIPRNKERFAAALANFVVSEFLNREVLTRRLHGIDFAGAVARWLTQNADTLSMAAKSVLPPVLGALDDAGMRRAVGEFARARFTALDVSPLAGEVLEILTSGERDQRLLSEILKQVRRVVAENEAFLHEEIRKGVRRSAKLLGLGRVLAGLRDVLAEHLADRVIERGLSVLKKASADPDHHLRVVLREQLERVIVTLKTCPKMQQKGEDWRELLLANPAVDRYMDDVWDEIKERILADVAHPESRIRIALEEGVAKAAQRLTQDPELAGRLDAWLEETVLAFAQQHQDEARKVIEETVQSWDGRQVADKLEREVWEDLQFIRLNGTLVGGLLGILIHALSLVF